LPKNMHDSSFSFTVLPPNVTMGKYTSIAANCFFHPKSDQHYCVQNPNFVSSHDFKHSELNAETTIGNDVWIGSGVRVLAGVAIGDGAIIGAGAVVAKDVPPYAVVVGNPGTIVKYRFPFDVIDKLRLIKWWEWDEDTVKSRLADFEDVYSFVDKYL